jgi:hypothetical protein
VLHLDKQWLVGYGSSAIEVVERRESGIGIVQNCSLSYFNETKLQASLKFPKYNPNKRRGLDSVWVQVFSNTKKKVVLKPIPISSCLHEQIVPYQQTIIVILLLILLILNNYNKPQ